MPDLTRYLLEIYLPVPYTPPPRLIPVELEARYQHCIVAAGRDVSEREISASRQLTKTLKREKNRRRVIFFAATPYFAIMRQALCLRDHGIQTVLVCTAPIPAELRAVFSTAFDHICDNLKSFTLFGDIATEVNAEALHMQLWMFTYHYARYVIEKCPDKKVICEFYDVSSTVLSRDYLCEMIQNTNMHGPIVDLDLEMERFIFQRASGVVHRMSSDLAERLKRKYEGSADLLTFYPWPLKRFTKTRSDKELPNPNRLKLVYAGALHPSSADIRFSPIAEMHSLFEDLLKQGHCIDVLNDPYRFPLRDDPDFKDWFRLETQYPGFRMLQGVSPDLLPETLSHYDFGLNTLTDNAETIRNRYETVMHVPGTKLFAYLEGGLPVLTHREATFLANYVNQYEIGVAPELSRFHTLSDALSDTDMAALYRNVAAFNEENSMDEKVHDLLDFYKNARVTPTPHP